MSLQKPDSNKDKCGGRSPHLYFILPALIIVFSILIFPVLFSFVVSTFEWPLLDASKRKFIGLTNYINLFKDKEFWHSFFLQIGFIFIAIPLELIIGFFVALLLNREFMGAGLIRTLLLLPVFFLPVLSGLTWKYMLQVDYGPINYILKSLGLNQVVWLESPTWSYVAVIIQDIWRMWPFMFMLLYAGLTGIPEELIEAAEVDGAGFWTKVFSIYIPLLIPTIITALLLRIIDALRIFAEVYVMTEGGPGNATTLFSLYTHKQAFVFFNVGIASSMAIFLLFVAIILAISLVKRNMNLDKFEGGE